MKNFDIKKFHVVFYEHLKSINSNFVFGLDESNNKNSTKISLTIPVVSSNNQDYDYSFLAKSFWWLMIDKILKHISKRKYSIGDPLVKHENLYYFTPDQTLIEMDKDYFVFVPFLKDTLYCKLEKPICDIKNCIQHINFSNQKLSLNFPIYL